MLNKTIALTKNHPGCYQMITSANAEADIQANIQSSKDLFNFKANSDDKYLYIGMAKDVKKRLKSYCYYKKLPTRLIRMLSQVNKIDIIYTDSEYEALVLEANLIKQIKPRYNILLKDDKSLARIKIETAHDFPKITKYRGKQSSPDVVYYGPFASSSDVNKAVITLMKMFKLRDCNDHSFKHRSRPCLQYQIKRCSAPCVGYIDKERYGLDVRHAINFLKGDVRGVKEALKAEMLEHSAKQEYEKALEIREKLEVFGLLKHEQLAQISLIKDADFLAIFRKGSVVAFGRAIWRGGKFCGQKVMTFNKSKEISNSEILEAWIKQNYFSNVIPRIILTSEQIENHSLLQNYLKTQAKRKVVIREPRRGVLLRLMNKLKKNLEEELYRKIMNLDQISELLMSLSEQLNHKGVFKHIEVYDNSHLSGSFGVCAKIVFRSDGFDKSSYRIYNINYDELVKTSSKMDDYAMFRQILTKRFKKLANLSAEEQLEQTPDLIIIDGGLGHLKLAKKIYSDYFLNTNLTIRLLAIAKGEDRNSGDETFYSLQNTSLENKDLAENSIDQFKLTNKPKLLFFLQRLRDEAHRFAITRNRKLRSKNIKSSILDRIPGVGEKRKISILSWFGSENKLKSASVSEI